jgi:hypothetical protein
MDPKMDNALPEGIDLELLEELENQNITKIRKLRKHARFELSVPVRLQPGNASAPEDEGQVGTSRDLSSGGCLVNFERPVGVGDVYRIRFLDDSLDLPLIFGRCLRCIMVRESVFEVGFSFFSQVSLDHLGNEESSDLID